MAIIRLVPCVNWFNESVNDRKNTTYTHDFNNVNVIVSD